MSHITIDFPITIRRATDSDQAGVARLAALDSATVPPYPVLLAESNGELRAARSLDNGETIADPFHPTAAIVELLATFAGPERQVSPTTFAHRWRRRRIRRRAVPRSPGGLLQPSRLSRSRT